MRALLPALALLGVAAPPPGAAHAQLFAGAPTAASVTIYRDRAVDAASLDELDLSQGLALISETRTLEVPAAGRVRVAFRGVADTMVPETVALQGLPGVLVERNEDFDLLTPGSLVAHSLGREVRVLTTGPGKARPTERTAVLRSGPDGVLLDFGGQVEALGCGGPPTRLVFDHAPAELSDKPTFSVLADVPAPGRYTVKLSYLATGFSWAADYVARINPDGRTLDLEGWLTLVNKSAAGFAHAPTDVVAGQLERDEATRPPRPQAQAIARTCWGQRRAIYAGVPLAIAPVEHRIEEPRFSELQEMVVTAAKVARQSDLGDYKLYTLPEPTEVAAHQTKQVAFLDQKAVPFERVYVVRLDEDTLRAPDDDTPALAPTVVLRLKNRREAGLGKPLPAGTVSVMETAAGALALAGEQTLDDTPVGLPVELKLGRAMDVPVVVRRLSERRVGHTVQTSIRVAFENDKPGAIVLEHRQPPLGEDFRIENASARSTLDKGDHVWTFRLGPGERAELRYTLSRRE